MKRKYIGLKFQYICLIGATSMLLFSGEETNENAASDKFSDWWN